MGLELRKRLSPWLHGVLSDLISLEFKMEFVLVISMSVQCDCSCIKTSKPFLLEYILRSMEHISNIISREDCDMITALFSVTLNIVIVYSLQQPRVF